MPGPFRRFEPTGNFPVCTITPKERVAIEAAKAPFDELRRISRKRGVIYAAALRIHTDVLRDGTLRIWNER